MDGTMTHRKGNKKVDGGVCCSYSKRSLKFEAKALDGRAVWMKS